MTERVKVLTGERISLVVPEKQDVEFWYKGTNDLETSMFIVSTFGKVTFKEDEEDFFEKLRKEENNNTFCIYINQEEKIIGNISLFDINYKNRNCELGIAIFDKENQNKGYGTESIKLILKYAFDILGLNKVKLGFLGSNERAKKVYEKIGFKEVGRFRDDIYAMGKYHDNVSMEIFREEFSF